MVANDDRRTALHITTVDAEPGGQLELALLGCTDFIEHQQVRADHLTQDVRLGLARAIIERRPDLADERAHRAVNRLDHAFVDQVVGRGNGQVGLARADRPQQQHAATYPAMLRKVVDVVGACIQRNLLGQVRHGEVLDGETPKPCE